MSPVSYEMGACRHHRHNSSSTNQRTPHPGPLLPPRRGKGEGDGGSSKMRPYKIYENESMNARFGRYVICWVAAFATLTPFVLRAYLVPSPEGLGKMTTNADIICKTRVVASVVITNAAFRPLPGFETRATRLEIISVLKGSSSARFMLFQHYASNPQDRIFGRMYAPQHYELETGQCYVVFAVKTGHDGEFRQIRFSHTGKEDEGAMRTLDDRSLANLPAA